MPVILPVSSLPSACFVPCTFLAGQIVDRSPVPLSLSQSPPTNSSTLPANPLKGALIFFCCCPKSRQFAASAFSWQRQHASSVCGNPPPSPSCHSWRLQFSLPIHSPSLSSLSSPAEYNERICIWRNLAWYAWQSHAPRFPPLPRPHTHILL